MPKEYSPFTPGVPVPIEFFVGRVAEVDRLKTAAKESTSGRLRVSFLTGERGIGKSSLAFFVRVLAEREHQVVGLHTFLGGVTSLEEMVRRVFDRLLKESIGKTWEGKVRDFFGNHIRQVGLFGVSVELGTPDRDLGRMVHDFVPAVRRLVDRLRDERKGLFLILDDINGLAVSAPFANWLKSIVDEIATSDEPLPLCLILVGLEDRRQALIDRQPSLARVFDIVDIRPWTQEEGTTFFQTAFSKVNVKIADAALSMLVRYSGGLPVLAHEIGDAVYRTDQDGTIDYDDAVVGILSAAEIVGRKYIEPRIFEAIRSERYRAILRKIVTQRFDIRFKRGDLRKDLTSDEAKVLDNFLRRMKGLGVVKTDPEGGPGAYRFDNLLHYLYISLASSRAQKAPGT